jgi:hypothetical protein
MRTSLLAATLLAAGAATAQIPIPAFGNTFTSTLTRGFWFQAPVPFVITGLRVPNEALQSFQVVEVIDLGAAAPPAYPATVNGTQLFYNNSTATGTVISTSIQINAGAFIGILGACTNTLGSTTSYNSYGTPAGAFTSSINGNAVTLTRFGTQFGIAAGGNQPCWQEPAGQISRVEVYVVPPTGYGYSVSYGSGCVSVPDVPSYENFATSASFDLANSGMTLIHIGTGYVAVPAITAYVPPSATAQVLSLADNAEATVALSQAMPVGASGTTTTLSVCSNGFISAGTGNGVGTTPTPSAFVNNQRAWWCLCWHDYNPALASGGRVKFEQIGNIAYVTWDGVWDALGTSAANANTMQAQFDVTTGIVHYHWQTMSTLGNGRMVGFSDAGSSTDPGSMNISAALPASFQAAVFAIKPLGHTLSARPVIGTTTNMLTANVPPGTVLGLSIVGITQFSPGIDLTSIGMPTCSLHASLDVLLSWLPAGGAGSLPFPIPGDPGLAGFQLNTQSATFTPGINNFGFTASNGQHWVVDLQ